MRIAYVITRADAVGGATIHVRDVAGAMRERGHDVLVLVGGEGPVTEQFAAAVSRKRRSMRMAHVITRADAVGGDVRDVAAAGKLPFLAALSRKAGV